MLVKMFLCFYLNVPPRSFNLTRLSYDENKVEPVAGDLQAWGEWASCLETVTSAAVTDPGSGLRQGLACGAEWCFSGCRRLPSAWTSVGRSQTCSVCTRLFILFYLQTFRYHELGFVVVVGV